MARLESHDVDDSDAALLRRIAERDGDAFDILRRRYARAVYALALRWLHDVDAAADATQRALTTAWQAATSEVPDREGAPRWLFTVARDAIAGHARDAGLQPFAPGTAAGDGWLAFRTHAAVARLPEEERVPLEFAYWGGHRPGEIAELLGLPAEVVQTHIRRGLEHLATCLSPNPPPEPGRTSGTERSERPGS
jgi:RNA polymerase sigma-70 factor, ECF subfamily